MLMMAHNEVTINYYQPPGTRRNPNNEAIILMAQPRMPGRVTTSYDQKNVKPSRKPTSFSRITFVIASRAAPGYIAITKK